MAGLLLLLSGESAPMSMTVVALQTPFIQVMPMPQAYRHTFTSLCCISLAALAEAEQSARAAKLSRRKWNFPMPSVAFQVNLQGVSYVNHVKIAALGTRELLGKSLTKVS